VAIREAGGVPLLWKTGHSLIKAKLKETGAPFAGEMSGHIFFGERWYGFDDAMYTAARLLEILSRHADPSAVLDALPTSFARPSSTCPAPKASTTRGGRTAGARGRRPAGLPGGEVGTIDGLRVDFADGFGLIRASNTTPVLVLRFEGHTPEALQRIETAVHGRAAQREARRAVAEGAGGAERTGPWAHSGQGPWPNVAVNTISARARRARFRPPPARAAAEPSARHGATRAGRR
jgi:phosphomannomutase